jgi:hypothetical protein
MEWSEPKVDWSGAWDGETYVGDYFSYIDYNRIKNNTLFIIGYASQMYQVTSVDLGAEKDEADLVYADEINAIEQALFTLDEETYGLCLRHLFLVLLDTPHHKKYCLRSNFQAIQQSF